MSSITQRTLKSQAVFLPVQATGVEYSGSMGDWIIYLAGEVIGYAGSQQNAWDRLDEALRVGREHRQRNRANG